MPATFPSASPNGAPIAARIEGVVERDPARVAVCTRAGVVTYGELNARANGISRALGETPRGTGAVAVLLEQGPAAVAAILAVLKTGRTFVPLDAADSSERVRGILADCRPSAIVTHAGLASGAPEATPIIDVDSLGADMSADNPGIEVPITATASMVYTSGSTGRPKGVRHSHQNLLHFAGVYGRFLSIQQEDRLSMLFSIGVGASNLDICTALVNGACLCPYDVRTAGIAGLADWLDESAVSVIHTVPTALRLLCNAMATDRRLLTTRVIDIAGEQLYGSDIHRLRARTPAGCAIVNHLGATEANVLAQCRVDALDLESELGAVPVGVPPAGVEIRLIDSQGEDAQPGQAGELVVHSPYLSVGYWERPDLNAAVFSDDPARPGWRVYRSGDLGYRGSDGQLYFLGRSDARVKIRGHSVDPIEVEAAMSLVPGVRDVAVVTRETPHGVGLAACLVADAGHCSPIAIRRHLRARLPPALVPGTIVFFDELPRIASGKVDRRSLSAMDLRERELPASAPPANALEQRVAELFCLLLNRESVGREDDFFLLGGDSLQAATLQIELERMAAHAIAAETLLIDSTVAGLTAAVRRDTGTQSASPALACFRAGGSHPTLFLVPGGTGRAFVTPHFLDVLGPEQPVYIFQTSGLGMESRRSVSAMADEYVREMRRVQPDGPYLLGALCVGGAVAAEMAVRLRSRGDRVSPLVFVDPPSVLPGSLRPWRRAVRASWVGMKRALPWLSWISPADRTTIAAWRRDPSGQVAAGVRISLDFQLALLKHRPWQFDGPAIVLRSAQFRNRSRMPGRHFADHLTGAVEWLEFHGRHRDIHGDENQDFDRQLDRAVTMARAALAPDASTRGV